jgi:demethylmenaquinone methyltransferase / 2-methoxy-6-polyprenyl-1,4-benzoquinol methylase
MRVHEKIVLGWCESILAQRAPATSFSALGLLHGRIVSSLCLRRETLSTRIENELVNGPDQDSRRAQYVQEMFSRIAHRYDFMNRVMTAGQDITWRKTVIGRAALRPGDRLLDLGAGTGDLAREALRQQPGCHPLAADFTLEMMRVGQLNPASSPIRWTAADALRLPLPAQAFDAVVSGFLMRNVVDLPHSLAEQFRVLKPGGRIVILDTTPPPPSVFTPFINFHLHTVIPTVGQLLSGQSDAYHYLPDTTENFLQPEQLAVRMLGAGFIHVGFERRMLGTIAIHWGSKPL